MKIEQILLDNDSPDLHRFCMCTAAVQVHSAVSSEE